MKRVALFEKHGKKSVDCTSKTEREIRKKKVVGRWGWWEGRGTEKR